MSKKKSNPKKHKFKHADPVAATQATQAPAGQVSKQAVFRSAAPVVSGRDFSYVGTDVRRIGLMVVGLILIELAFYYALVFTPIGAAVYRLVNV
jgi:hypothetical protein